MAEQIEAGVEPSIIRVLVADDHGIVRRGVRALLSTEPEIEVVGEAQDGLEAIEEAEKLQPDVILMDLVMPRVGGLDAIRRIAARQPKIRILVLTSFAGDDKIFPALEAGAQGYLLKDSRPEELVCAIRQVSQGTAGGRFGFDSPIVNRRTPFAVEESGWIQLLS